MSAVRGMARMEVGMGKNLLLDGVVRTLDGRRSGDVRRDHRQRRTDHREATVAYSSAAGSFVTRFRFFSTISR